MSLPKYEHHSFCFATASSFPSHWSVTVLKRVFRIVGGSTPDSTVSRFWDGDIPWATPADLGNGSGFDLATTQRRLTSEGVNSCGTTLVPPGTIVLSTRAPIGSIGIASAPLCTNQGCKSLVPSKRANSRYYAYALSASASALVARGKGTTFLELSADVLGRFPVPLPPMGEQVTIATFLDRETAKIDALVAEQDRLIDLLKEKRRVAILQMATKGLRSNVPFKESGVFSIRQVPTHWSVVAIRSLADVVRGASPRPAGDPRFFNGADVPWVTVGEITKTSDPFLLDTETCLTSEGAQHSRLIPSGTLVYSNSGATLGVPKILQIEACANDGVLAFLDLAPHVRPLFLYYYLDAITPFIRQEIRQGSGQPNLNTDLVKAIRVPVPPEVEQDAILNGVERLQGSFASLEREVVLALNLLQERRSALVSAAVTGQIDVRGLVAA